MLTFLILAACSTEATPAAKPKSRVDAVAAAPKKAVDTEAFCDGRDVGTFAWPELEGAPPPKPATWRWVNVWATWCKPCIAEMPMIREWATRLGTESVPVSQEFLSVDATAAVLSTFMAQHAAFPATSRLKDVTGLQPWLTSVGLDSSASLPLHLFVDDKDQIRCVRMGALGENDYEAIKAVIQGK